MSNIQVSLLNGQLLIPMLYDQIGEDNVNKTLGELNETSEIFERNFLRYFILNKARENFYTYGSGANYGLSYRDALALKDEYKLKKILRVNESKGYDVSCIDNKCFITFNELERIELPSYESLNRGSMIQHPSTQELVNAKFTTLSNMRGYTFAQELEKENKLDARAYRLLLLYSARELPRL